MKINSNSWMSKTNGTKIKQINNTNSKTWVEDTKVNTTNNNSNTSRINNSRHK